MFVRRTLELLFGAAAATAAPMKRKTNKILAAMLNSETERIDVVAQCDSLSLSAYQDFKIKAF